MFGYVHNNVLVLLHPTSHNASRLVKREQCAPIPRARTSNRVQTRQAIVSPTVVARDRHRRMHCAFPGPACRHSIDSKNGANPSAALVGTLGRSCCLDSHEQQSKITCVIGASQRQSWKNRPALGDGGQKQTCCERQGRHAELVSERVRKRQATLALKRGRLHWLWLAERTRADKPSPQKEQTAAECASFEVFDTRSTATHPSKSKRNGYLLANE